MTAFSSQDEALRDSQTNGLQTFTRTLTICYVRTVNFTTRYSHNQPEQSEEANGASRKFV
jgi:hypothetical protein